MQLTKQKRTSMPRRLNQRKGKFDHVKPGQKVPGELDNTIKVSSTNYLKIYIIIFKGPAFYMILMATVPIGCVCKSKLAKSSM